MAWQGRSRQSRSRATGSYESRAQVLSLHLLRALWQQTGGGLQLQVPPPPRACIHTKHSNAAPAAAAQTAFREKLVRRQLRHEVADGRRRHTMRLMWWVLAMVPQVCVLMAWMYFCLGAHAQSPLMQHMGIARHIPWPLHPHLHLPLVLLFPIQGVSKAHLLPCPPAALPPSRCLPARLPAAAADADPAAQPHRLLHRLPHLLALQGPAGGQGPGPRPGAAQLPTAARTQRPGAVGWGGVGWGGVGWGGVG